MQNNPLNPFADPNLRRLLAYGTLSIASSLLYALHSSHLDTKPVGLFLLFACACTFALILVRLPRTLYRLLHVNPYLQRLRNGHCPHCNYDLRASPTRCPECGQHPATAPHPSPEPAPLIHATSVLLLLALFLLTCLIFLPPYII